MSLGFADIQRIEYEENSVYTAEIRFMGDWDAQDFADRLWAISQLLKSKDQGPLPDSLTALRCKPEQPAEQAGGGCADAGHQD